MNRFILCFLRFALSLSKKLKVKIGCISTIKTNKFVLYCLRFALSLHIEEIKSENLWTYRKFMICWHARMAYQKHLAWNLFQLQNRTPAWRGMKVDERNRQPFGFLSGGATLALAENLAGIGSLALCPGRISVGINVSGSHVKAVAEGDTVTAYGRLIHKGTHTPSVDDRNLQQQERTDFFCSGDQLRHRGRRKVERIRMVSEFNDTAMSSYAIYRLPYQHECTCVSQRGGSPRELLSCAELSDKKGFVVAPFMPSSATPVVVICPDVVEHFDVRPCSPPCRHEVRNADAHLKEKYLIDFANFHAQLESGEFRKIVLSRCSKMESAEALQPEDLFMRACQLYPRMFVALVSTPQNGHLADGYARDIARWRRHHLAHHGLGGVP
jgi:uncharacterized protein (TIGR00369 family)